jgi:hypothetical protein
MARANSLKTAEMAVLPSQGAGSNPGNPNWHLPGNSMARVLRGACRG